MRSRRSMRTYQRNELTRNSSGDTRHSRLSSLHFKKKKKKAQAGNESPNLPKKILAASKKPPLVNKIFVVVHVSI